MPVPSFQSFMLSLLKLAGDQKEHTFREVEETLATEFHLSDADRNELLPSGTQARFANRVRWAQKYLKEAELLESCGRGRFRITGRGSGVLGSNPPEINTKFLEQFDEFREFKGLTALPTGNETQEVNNVEQPQLPPSEALESIYQSLRRDLAQELLALVKKCSPNFFERLVIDLLVSMGYGGSRRDAAQAVGGTGDGGIDGVIKEDKLGLDVVYVQAKRWEGVVGRPTVQAFAGSLDGERARKGVLITTSQFSKEAIEYVHRIDKKIVLIGGERLAQYMIDHGVGVTEVTNYTVKKVDLDYFEEEL
ncbi:MAG: restriction endonuclease [Chloroflexota bacterium]|nr:MAG: restriction endonuclease [Chloroflexota bacterium]